MMERMRRWIILCEAKHSEAEAIIMAWVNDDGHRDTATWTRLFASVQSSLEQTKPTTSVRLWRNEHRDNEAQYDRFTSWTTDRAIAADYPAGGGRNRQVVSAMIDPADMVCFVPAFGARIDWLNQKEMIVRPGRYQRQPTEPIHSSSFM